MSLSLSLSLSLVMSRPGQFGRDPPPSSLPPHQRMNKLQTGVFFLNWNESLSLITFIFFDKLILSQRIVLLR
jgi:hypothetical protein